MLDYIANDKVNETMKRLIKAQWEIGECYRELRNVRKCAFVEEKAAHEGQPAQTTFHEHVNGSAR